MHQARIEMLQAMPIFGGIQEGALRVLVELAPEVVVKKDDFFFRENDQASSMFVLETGKVAVLKSWQGRECLLRHLGKGDCFGEMALMDLFPRSASIRAVEDCTAIELSAENLYRLYEKDLQQFAIIQMNMGREVCRRLRQSDEELFRAKMGAPDVGGHEIFRAM